MKLLRPLVALTSVVLLVGGGLIWWNLPTKVDMANYAPADSLVYVEVNSLVDITNALKQSAVLRPFLPFVAIDSRPTQGWTFSAARAGLAPTTAVVSSRAQAALVVTNIETTEDGDSLHVRPEAALVIETQTSKWRMKSSAFSAVQQLAQFAYGGGTCTELPGALGRIECIDPKSSRKIVAIIDGSVVIIGNSEKAVQQCLEVHQGKRPSLRTDQELAAARANLKSESALAFGYVSQSNAAKLVSFAAPLLLGRAPGDGQLEELLSKNAGKILRGIAWTSRSLDGGIEDRYQIALEPEVIKRLEPAFDTAAATEDFWKLVPEAFRSVTIYRSKDPRAAWSSLDSAVAVKLDAVSSVIVSALLKAGLASYSIDDPKQVLENLSSPVITLRPVLGEDSLLLGRVKNEKALRAQLASTFAREANGQIVSGTAPELSRQSEFTALFADGFVIVGKTESVRIYLAQLQNNEMLSPEHLETLQLKNREKSAAIVTYSNEQSSVESVITALAKFSGQSLSDKQISAIQEKLDNKVAFTESSLNSSGIERRTQSAFGQFGNLISLAVADSTQTSR
jgi:hypothetical protein